MTGLQQLLSPLGSFGFREIDRCTDLAGLELQNGGFLHVDGSDRGFHNVFSQHGRSVAPQQGGRARFTDKGRQAVTASAVFN